MNKIFLVLAFLLLPLTSFSYAANNSYQTHLDMYDATVGGEMTSSTKEVYIILTIKGTDNGLDPYTNLVIINPFLFPDLYDLRDVEGNRFNLKYFASQFLGSYSFNQLNDGETTINLGKFELSPANPKTSSNPKLGLVLNLTTQIESVNNGKYRVFQNLRASKVISFSGSAH